MSELTKWLEIVNNKAVGTWRNCRPPTDALGYSFVKGVTTETLFIAVSPSCTSSFQAVLCATSSVNFSPARCGAKYEFSSTTYVFLQSTEQLVLDSLSTKPFVGWFSRTVFSSCKLVCCGKVNWFIDSTIRFKRMTEVKHEDAYGSNLLSRTQELCKFSC